MNALINLRDCKEHMTIELNDNQYQIKVAGTVEDPYFCGKDVCDVLGYEAHKFALQKFVDEDEKSSLRILEKLGVAATPNFLGATKASSYHNGKAIYISEAGLYSLIMSSQAPFAKEFRKLVCKVILPSIRKFGSYSVEQQLSVAMGQLALKEVSEEELQKQLEEERRRANEEQQRANEACSRLRSETKRHKEQIKRDQTS